MNNDVRIGGFTILPPVVKNLLILNVLFFLAKIVCQKYGVDLDVWLGLHYFTADAYRPWQIVTYMFMHGNFAHLFFNMFALWMFGAVVENYWGSKRFLLFYLITGVGAAMVQYGVMAYSTARVMAVCNQFLDAPTIDNLMSIRGQFGTKSEIYKLLTTEYINPLTANPGDMERWGRCINDITYLRDNWPNLLPACIGASGAVFGLLLAFGMLFPNSQIYLYFLIPMKAKWFVILYGLLELFFGVSGAADGVAHFAHLGGMLFGILLILLWRKKDRSRQYNGWNEY